MAFLVVLIVDNPDDCPAILNDWDAAGIRGVTILESTGMGRLRRLGMLEDIPLMPSMSDLLESGEVHHRTLFSVVEDEAKVDQMVAIAEKILGNLDEDHTGFLFVVPVVRVYGLGKRRDSE
jgi:nitrogen regulatory protein PII